MEPLDRHALTKLGLVGVDEVDVLSGHATHHFVGAGDVVERVGELDEVVDLFLGQFRHWMFSFCFGLVFCGNWFPRWGQGAWQTLACQQAPSSLIDEILPFASEKKLNYFTPVGYGPVVL